MVQHRPQTVKKQFKSSDTDILIYLEYLTRLLTWTVGEASLVTGLSEDILNDALGKNELFLSSGRLVKKSVEEWLKIKELTHSTYKQVTAIKRDIKIRQSIINRV
jgi:hypothetical protein